MLCKAALGTLALWANTIGREKRIIRSYLLAKNIDTVVISHQTYPEVFVCGYRPKTKELLELLLLFLFFSIRLISSLKDFKSKKIFRTGNRTRVHQLTPQVLLYLSVGNFLFQ